MDSISVAALCLIIIVVLVVANFEIVLSIVPKKVVKRERFDAKSADTSIKGRDGYAKYVTTGTYSKTFSPTEQNELLRTSPIVFNPDRPDAVDVQTHLMYLDGIMGEGRGLPTDNKYKDDFVELETRDRVVDDYDRIFAG
jgi:hypothetical protein